MHRLLIVDDDEILRTGIEKNIDWSSNGIEIVGTAANGHECLEMIRDCLPHIVLTDIKMPFMDGLDLSEALYHLYPNIQVVLLTAYNDFEYAKRALNFKVVSYVMKYEDNDTILNAVKKAAAEYDKLKNRTEIVRRSSKLLIDHFLQETVRKPGPLETTLQQASQLGLNLSEAGFQAVCLNVSSRQERGGHVIWQDDELFEQCGCLLVDCIKSEHRHAYEFVAREHFNILLNSNSELCCEDLETILTGIEKVLNLSITAGVGEYYRDLFRIHKSYEQAVQALENISEFAEDNSRKVFCFSDREAAGCTHAAVAEEVKKYIRNNYGNENLSLNLIAQEVHLSSSYISTVFKKNCKINIIDYITEIRIEKAKKLLAGTDLKIYQIAGHVGYSNSQYFSVLFKKSTGDSPVEYRAKFGEHFQNSDDSGRE